MFDLNKFNLDGDESLIINKSNFNYLAILGSRNMLSYTQEILENFFESISSYKNIVIVSGGMYGVDLLAHNLALRYNLGTILFIPSGIASYKKSYLYKSLKIGKDSKVLLVSKYPDFFNSRKYTYLERNRLIVDFCKVVLIAQSGIKSGSIYSGNYSLKVGKTIFCIPFSLSNGQFMGNNFLISRGARIYLNHEDVLESLGVDSGKKLLVSDLLKLLPSETEQLYKELNGYKPQEIEKTLLEAILKGKIFLENGIYFKK